MNSQVFPQTTRSISLWARGQRYDLCEIQPLHHTGNVPCGMSHLRPSETESEDLIVVSQILRKPEFPCRDQALIFFVVEGGCASSRLIYEYSNSLECRALNLLNRTRFVTGFEPTCMWTNVTSVIVWKLGFETTPTVIFWEIQKSWGFAIDWDRLLTQNQSWAGRLQRTSSWAEYSPALWSSEGIEGDGHRLQKWRKSQ